MNQPKSRIGALQDIQWEIARIVDKYWALPDYVREIVRWLKEGFTEINDAKGAVYVAIYGDPFENADKGQAEQIHPSELPKE